MGWVGQVEIDLARENDALIFIPYKSMVTAQGVTIVRDVLGEIVSVGNPSFVTRPIGAILISP